MMKKVFGFTIVEIVAVVAILGILAAIAIPTYQGYKLRANRTDMKQMMQSIAQQMQVYKVNNSYNYTNATFASATSTTLTNSATPITSQYPLLNPNYKLQLQVFDASGTTPPVTAGATWVLTAQAQGSQLKDGNLVINEQGWTCWNKTNGTSTNLCVNSKPTSTSTWDGN